MSTVHVPPAVLLPPPGLSVKNDAKPSALVLSFSGLEKSFAHMSPISVLHDECGRNGIVLRYELLASDGPDHEKLFTYRVTAGDRTATASGTSRKKARHACAALVISEMYSNDGIARVSPNDMQEDLSERKEETSSDADVPAFNPVGSTCSLLMRDGTGTGCSLAVDQLPVGGDVSDVVVCCVQTPQELADARGWARGLILADFRLNFFT